MASQHPEFEYDIFISYRHNDNRGGWVTEFVKNLKEEIASIIKEPVSVYFDSNLYDGLLETHNVDKSLEGKLKSLIFIPILSQIYCDTKSFAWQHEFQAYNKSSLGDLLGRDVALKNGNVASRILPIVIHNLDLEDISLIESELKAKLRSIDFTFRASGVNRPLRKEDQRGENINALSYHDQLNKIANAVKEIIAAIRNPGRVPETGVATKLKQTLALQAGDEKSLAVLPFANLSQDTGQEYFSDGITENIIIQLSTLPHFRVISRTSVMRYKKTTKSAAEIAGELNVKYLLEGSAQSHKDKVRISVQLIDASQDKAVWSKVFVESLDDIFTIQNAVAEVIAKALDATLTPAAIVTINEVPTKNVEAYDLFLKGRHAYNRWSVEGYTAATAFFNKALALDPEFKEAYSYLASSYSARMSWNGDLSPEDAYRNIIVNLEQAWQRGPTDNDYLTKGFVEFFISKDFAAAEQQLLAAISANPNNALAMHSYAYLLNMMGRFAEAEEIISSSRSIEPLSIGYFNHLAIGLYLTGHFNKAIEVLTDALQLHASVLRFYDFLAKCYLATQRYQDVIDVISQGLRQASVRPPSMVASMASAYAGLNDPAKPAQLAEELIGRSAVGEKGVNIYLVYVYLALGNQQESLRWLAKARITNDVDLIWLNVDPLLKNLDEKAIHVVSPDFEAAKAHVNELLETKMPALPYHNRAHINDVLQSALKIAESESLSEPDLRLLSLAALLHDLGFIKGAKDHEQNGAEMARELLPLFGYGKNDVDKICEMILATRLPQSPATLLESILCDADLDYLGRDDFYEIGGRLFIEMRAAGVVESEREWNLVQRTFLQSHKYHTHFSKTNREPKKQAHIVEVAGKLKP